MSIKTVGDLLRALQDIDPTTPVATVVVQYVDHGDCRPFRSQYIRALEDRSTPGGIILVGDLAGSYGSEGWVELTDRADW